MRRPSCVSAGSATVGVVARQRRPLRLRLPHDEAAVPIHDDLLPLLDLEQARACPNDHRQAQRTRDDRRVRRDSATGERDSSHRGRQLRDVGRTQRNGDEHTLRNAPRGALEVRCRASPDAAHVIGAQRQRRVRQK